MQNNHSGLKAALMVLMVILIAATGWMIKLSIGLAGSEVPEPPVKQEEPALQEPVTVQTEAPTETTAPQPEHVVSTATIGAMGDLLMHKPIFDDHEKYNAAVQQPDGSYDFSMVFQYIAEPISRLDYAAANLETTLVSNDNGYGYNGYPLFNCPDALVDGVREAGFDLLLTANNHSYDTGMTGLNRTLEVIRGRGLDTLGTYLSEDETKWTLQDVNGIRVGMLCYTYATGVAEQGRPSLNDNQAIEQPGRCNYFYTGNLDHFYSEVEGYLDEMEEAGAEATILFIHWGNEYQLTENQIQNQMAQRLCDLGVDVIIGGHPHVVQPVELLTSTQDPDHKTVCLYSMGNAVSAQRRHKMNLKTGHTEDGVIFQVTFSKYSDGTVILETADAIPTWVNDQYQILSTGVLHTPEPEEPDPTQPTESTETNPTESTAPAQPVPDETTRNQLAASYERTMGIVGDGLAAVQAYLQSNTAQVEAELGVRN